MGGARGAGRLRATFGRTSHMTVSLQAALDHTERCFAKERRHHFSRLFICPVLDK